MAYSHCLKAVELLEPQGESPLLAQAYARLGFYIGNRQGPVSAAISLTEKGLALAERLGDTGKVGEGGDCSGIF
jgi:hypothetical protein